MWAADYAATAISLWSRVPRDRRAVLRPQPGERVLDGACGSGNAASRRRRPAATPSGSQLAPGTFPGRACTVPRRRGSCAEWVEATPKALRSPTRAPTSRAPCSAACSRRGTRRPRASWRASCGPAGDRTLQLVAEGEIGDFFATIGGHVPPPPPTAAPLLLWGTEDYVRGLRRTGVELEFERNEIPFSFASARGKRRHVRVELRPDRHGQAAARAAGTLGPRWPIRSSSTGATRRAAGRGAFGAETSRSAGRLSRR